MIMVNIAEAKAKLSEFIDALGRGETVVICRHNRPVAELRRVEAAPVGKRDLTPLFPDWKIDPAFFDPLGPEEIATWESGDPGRVPHVGESRPVYGTTRKSRKRR